MYNKKKKMDKKYIFLIIAALIILSVSFAISIMKTNRDLNPVEKVIKDISLKVSSVIYAPVKFVKNKIQENKEKNNIYKKYQELQKKYDSIHFNEAKIDELEKEIKDLKNILEIENVLSEYDTVNATIINRNVDFWDDTITIDKGTSSGITKDMAVVTSKGLIGKVIQTSNLYSTVRLLTSDRLGQKVSVKLQISDEKFVYGLLSGYDAENKYFLIEGISENVEVPQNSSVTTTGMSSIFPSGVLVGYTVGIRKDNFDLAAIVEVKPEEDLDDLEFVTVLKRKSVS